MGAITQLKTRSLYSVIKYEFFWDATLNIGKYSYGNQEFFFQNLQNQTAVVNSDASSTGMAAHVM